MKNLLLILVSLVFISACKKNNFYKAGQVAAESANGFKWDAGTKTFIPASGAKTMTWWTEQATCNNDAYGVRSTFEVKRFGGGTQRSVWAACNTNNGYWAQVGYTDRGFVLQYYDLWRRPTKPYPVQLGTPTLSIGTRQTFSLYLKNRSLFVAVDSVDYFELPLDADYIFSQEVATEADPSYRPPNFTTINFYPALQKLTVEGSWVDCPTAALTPSSCGWGAEGINQNPSLRVCEINMGSQIKSKCYMILW